MKIPFSILLLAQLFLNLAAASELWIVRRAGQGAEATWRVDLVQQRLEWQRKDERVLMDFKAGKIHEWDRRKPEAVTQLDFAKAREHDQMIRNASLESGGFAPSQEVGEFDAKQWRVHRSDGQSRAGACSKSQVEVTLTNPWQETQKHCVRKNPETKRLAALAAWSQKMPPRYKKMLPDAQALFLFSQGYLLQDYQVQKVNGDKTALKIPKRTTKHRDYAQGYLQSLQVK